MARLEFEVAAFDFASLDQFGDAHPLARLAHEAEQLGFPLLTIDRASHLSRSPFQKSSGLSHLAWQNPSLPSLPEDARFVVAGQQPGLLTGPLYTFLKASGGIALAGKLSKASNHAVLPLFWVASEDHDVLEVNHVTVNGRRFVCSYDGEIARGKVPQIRDISIEDVKEPLLEFLREMLPETEFRPWVLDMVTGADFSNYASAFTDLMRAIFVEWQIWFADAGGLRQFTAPVLATLASKWPEVVAAFERGTQRVGAAGFEPPVESPGLFEIVEGFRVPVEIEAETMKLSTGKMSFGKAAEEINKRPNDFSPNAALRPVLQDGVLPVVATIAGPSELVYLWQIQPIFEVAGVSPSLLMPRVSATFVEDKIRKAAEKAGLGRERIFEAEHRLKDQLAQASEDPQVVTVQKKGEELREAVGNATGPNPSRALERNRRAIAAQIEKLVRRLSEEKLEEKGLGRRRREKISQSLLPGGKPQERVVNVIQYLNLYGADFVRRAVETLDPFSPNHQAAFISTAKEQ